MTILPLPQHVREAVAPLRGKCLDLEGVTDTPPAEPLPALRPVTIGELLAGWQWAKEGYGENTAIYRVPYVAVALTLRDIATRQLRIATLLNDQVAFIEGEPSSIDLTDRPEATRRLAKYAWFTPPQDRRI